MLLKDCIKYELLKSSRGFQLVVKITLYANLKMEKRWKTKPGMGSRVNIFILRSVKVVTRVFPIVFCGEET